MKSVNAAKILVTANRVRPCLVVRRILSVLSLIHIFLAFDKQYKDNTGLEWELYERKTKGLAERVGAHVSVSRICDKVGLWLDYKLSLIHI